MAPIAVTLWRWGPLFEPIYVERMVAMLARHLHLPHRVYCFTDDPDSLPRDVIPLPIPRDLAALPRCRRRMWQYNRIVDGTLGRRMLSIDLDCVITDDITPLIARTEPVCMWRVRHANVLSGSLVLWDAGALDGAWRAFDADRDGYPLRSSPRGIGSDQSMINLFAKESRTPIAEWSEGDGITTYYGRGYERLEHMGVGPNRQTLPAGTRLVVLGSSDKRAMDSGAYPWVVDHWR